MVEKDYLGRIKLWRTLRTKIEDSQTPIKDVLNFWNTVPVSGIAVDPYDINRWPNPWELLKENNYCEFSKMLAIYYTLQLTARFPHSRFEIHIVLDQKESAIKYLLFVDNHALGYYNDRSITTAELPKMESQMRHVKLPTYQ